VGRGGAAELWPPPSPAATPRLGAPQAPNTGGLKTGFSNTRLDLKKNTKDGIVSDFKKLPQKPGQSASEILGR